MKQAVLLTLLAVLLLMPAGLAFADCSQTSPPTCSYVPTGQTVTVTPQAFSNPSPSCESVDNSNCPSALMVPTASQAEWTSFIANHPGCAQLSSCEAADGKCGSWNGWDGETTSSCPTGGDKTYCANGTEQNWQCTHGKVGSVSVCNCTWSCVGSSTTAKCSAKATSDN